MEERQPWIEAAELEQTDDNVGAAALYLKDAYECLIKGWLPKTAVCCSCAAQNVDALGGSADAAALFFEAGSLYEENSERVIGESLVEALWSLGWAYRCFERAGAERRSKSALDRYTLLAKRVDPFGLPELDVPRAIEGDAHLPKRSSDRTLPLQLKEVIEQFLRLRDRMREAGDGDGSTALQLPDARAIGGDYGSEEGTFGVRLGS